MGDAAAHPRLGTGVRLGLTSESHRAIGEGALRACAAELSARLGFAQLAAPGVGTGNRRPGSGAGCLGITCADPSVLSRTSRTGVSSSPLGFGGADGVGIVEGGDDLGVEVAPTPTDIPAQRPAGGLVGVGGALQDVFDAADEGVAGFLLLSDGGLAVGVVAVAVALGKVGARCDGADGADVQVPFR
ncbi:hypothetical protein [Streptomyces sp. CRN 30]|uniref:hypothetical protein n=1 Tax=Streptomyces sp. CRN 30 TaxID=3075613 RepID=UPI002A7F9C98|nr:hypothetical protein [Streptomyces sp. CRN 30]